MASPGAVMRAQIMIAHLPIPNSRGRPQLDRCLRRQPQPSCDVTVVLETSAILECGNQRSRWEWITAFVLSDPLASRIGSEKRTVHFVECYDAAFDLGERLLHLRQEPAFVKDRINQAEVLNPGLRGEVRQSD